MKALCVDLKGERNKEIAEVNGFVGFSHWGRESDGGRGRGGRKERGRGGEGGMERRR